MVSCPYNKNHIIRKNKLIDHIYRCKESKSSRVKIQFCLSDTSYIIKEDKYQNHIKRCVKCYERDNALKGNIDLDESLNVTCINKFMNDDKDSVYNDILSIKNETTTSIVHDNQMFNNSKYNMNLTKDSKNNQYNDSNSNNTFRNGYY